MTATRINRYIDDLDTDGKFRPDMFVSRYPQKILEMLDGKKSTLEIMEKVGASRYTVKTYLDRMYADKIIDRDLTNKLHYYWKIDPPK